MSDFRPTASMTALNRKQLRRLGLSAGEVRRLFEESAQTVAERDGCTCGVLRIEPVPTGAKRDGSRVFDVRVFHETFCYAHPMRAAERAERAQKRLGARASRALARVRHR